MQLKKDIDEDVYFTDVKDKDGNIITAKRRIKVYPKVLWESRPEYGEYPLRVFADHIKQELGTRQYYHTVKTKGKKKPHHWAELAEDAKVDTGEGAETVMRNIYLEDSN